MQKGIYGKDYTMTWTKGKCSKAMLALLLASYMVSNCATPIIANTNTRNAVVKERVTYSEDALRRMTNPVLQHYTVQKQELWQMSSNTRLVILANEENMKNNRLKEVVQLVNSEFMDKEIGANKSTPLAMIYAPRDAISTSDILVTVDRKNPISEETVSEEAYKIEIDENGVRLTGASETAVLYGLRTIQQLMIANDGLVYGTIVDYPDMKERRIHVDCARKYISKNWFIRLIREMSYMKMNALQMHFSENLGFRIECETDPAIVSKDGYLTKQEVREIIAEANKYGVKIIPSFDSPGHVDQILKAHPEFGQVSNTGEHYKSGLDITNPKAVEYIRSLYSEYMDLFEGCTDFHIGGDEYMEFDRPPFTTQYQSVLNEYAKKTYGEGYTWKDAVAGYINDLAEFVHERGFTPRIWNDGIYYGESYAPQKIKMHDYIGIDFWSQMSWNPSIAKLQTFVDKGHDTIYNINASFFYYVLRNDKPTDGREQHSFDNLNADKKIFEEFTPGKFQSNTVDDNSAFIKGASLGIWCDNPNLVDEEVIMDDIHDEMRALASKSWNTQSNANYTFEQFKESYTKLGNVAGYEKGTKLPYSGEVILADDLGKVTLRYVTEDGKSIKNDAVKYGKIGENFEFNADAIYGYRLLSEQSVQGIYQKEEAVYTFVYELYCDKTQLRKEIEQPLLTEHYIRETISDYTNAYTQAKIVYEKENSTQLEVDQALQTLLKAKEKAIHLDFYPLYVEAMYPLTNEGYISGYEEYLNAVEKGRAALKDQALTVDDMRACFDEIVAAKGKLMKPDGNIPTVKATDAYYSSGVYPADKYSYEKMLDHDPSTKTWFNADQTKDKTIQFVFPNVVKMSQIKIEQPKDCGEDIIEGADVEVSLDGQQWTKVGDLNNVLDKTITFEGTNVKYVQIRLTKDKKKWYQIQDIYFTFEQIQEDNTLRDLIQEAENLDYLTKDIDYVSELGDKLIAAQKAYIHKEEDTQKVEDDLRKAMQALQTSGVLDFTELNELIAYAEKIDLSNYTNTEEFAEALKAAKECAINARSQREITAAKNQLKNAIDTLEEKEETPVDKKVLEEKLCEAKALDATKYTKESYQVLEKAIKEAEGVLHDQDATQEDVNRQVLNLKAAIDALEVIDVKPIDPIKPSEPTDPMDNETTEIPNTADRSNLGIWIGLLGVSTIVLRCEYAKRKYKR